MKGHICDNCECHLDDSDYTGVGQWSYFCHTCGFTYRHGAAPAQEQVDKFNKKGKTMKIKDIKEKFHADAYSVKNGVFTVRRSFFYRMGKSTETFRADVLAKFPNAVIMDSGEKYVAFRGGDSVAQGSHWWVKFTIPE